MAKYKIESTYLEFPIVLETESNEEAYEMFTAYCDYQDVDEEDIECEYDDEGICSAMAKRYSEAEELPAIFTFDKIKEGVSDDD